MNAKTTTENDRKKIKEAFIRRMNKIIHPGCKTTTGQNTPFLQWLGKTMINKKNKVELFYRLYLQFGINIRSQEYIPNGPVYNGLSNEELKQGTEIFTQLYEYLRKMFNEADANNAADTVNYLDLLSSFFKKNRIASIDLAQVVKRKAKKEESVMESRKMDKDDMFVPQDDMLPENDDLFAPQDDMLPDSDDFFDGEKPMPLDEKQNEYQKLIEIVKDSSVDVFSKGEALRKIRDDNLYETVGGLGWVKFVKQMGHPSSWWADRLIYGYIIRENIKKYSKSGVIPKKVGYIIPLKRLESEEQATLWDHVVKLPEKMSTDMVEREVKKYLEEKAASEEQNKPIEPQAKPTEQNNELDDPSTRRVTFMYAYKAMRAGRIIYFTDKRDAIQFGKGNCEKAYIMIDDCGKCFEIGEPVALTYHKEWVEYENQMLEEFYERKIKK